MSFVSLNFLCFFCIVLMAYYIVPVRWQWLVLLGADYIFYMWSGCRIITYIMVTTITTFTAAYQIEEANEKVRFLKKIGNGLSEEEAAHCQKRLRRKRQVLLWAVLVLNFGILLVLKYLKLPHLSVVLPLGISFYTFQSMSYLIDVYRGKYEAEKNFARFALYISFFPQLVQGPISRYDQLANQLYKGHVSDIRNLSFGAQRMLWGFFKKLVVADRLAVMMNTVFENPREYQGFYVIFAGIFYSFQVYTDFSGGMDIAIGAAEMFGICLTENFQRPFFAQNLSEYWRRWHISLNDWLRDYVFYPVSLSRGFVKLGQVSRKVFGNRFGKYFAIYIATFIVRIINAIWHGGEAKYFVNGFYNGLLIILGLQCQPLFTKLRVRLRVKADGTAWKIFGICRTFALISLGRILVKAENFTVGLGMVKSVFTTFNPWILFDESLYQLGIGRKEFQCVLAALGLIFWVSYQQEKGYHIRECISRQNLAVRWLIYYTAVFSVLILGVYGIGYDAGGFIYMQF